jgi:thiamine pyrophosphate-dependent acetolactate synthase large subunit-like protein
VHWLIGDFPKKKAAVERATAAIRSIERLIYRADIGVNEEERRRIEKEVTELERRRKEDERARQRAAEEHRERLRQQTDKSAEGTPRDMIDAMQKELEEKASPDTD